MSGVSQIRDTAEGVNSRSLSAVRLVENAIAEIEKYDEYQALISVPKERALKRAKQIDESIKKGHNAGRLAGVPFIAKDNFLTFGGHTTAASNILKTFTAPYQATAIERLESEGAICVGKSNLDAFAHGSSTENSDFFVTKNPKDKQRVPGGSSGGSAAAVALGIVPFALGTDTGGSVRLPASFCGVVGYKPTYGLVSRSGVVAMASSTDVIGPLTNNVRDAAYVLAVMSGKDELDSTTIDSDSDGYELRATQLDFKNIKIGVIKEYLGDGLDPAVGKAVLSAVEKIKSQGARVETISLPSLPLALAVYYVICPAEVASNLGRYDGQRYGYSDQNAKNLSESYELSRENGFGAEAKRRIMIGTYVLSSGYYDAYYKKAQTVRTKIINEFESAFGDFDVLIGPTAPEPAFKIGQNTDDPLKMYLTDIMTVASNIAGNPSISIPLKTDSRLPIGLQIIAAQRQDKKLLQIADKMESLLS